MRLSTVLQYWIIFAVLPLISLAAPVNKPGKGKEPAAPPGHLPSQDASHHTPSQSTSQHPAAQGAPQHPHGDGPSGSSDKFSPGQIIMAKAKNFEGADASILTKAQKDSAGMSHPQIVVGGPHPDGKYTVASVSHKPDPLGIGRPVIEANHVIPDGHALGPGYIGLKPEKLDPKDMSPSHKHPVPLDQEQLDKLKGHMEPYGNWKPGDPVAPEHKPAGHSK